MWSIAALILGGALYALAFPPYGWSVLAWIAVVPLLLVVRGRSAWTGFLHGLVYGCAFGWLVTGWSAQAVVRYFGMPWPVAILVLSVFYVVIFIPNFGLFGAGAAVLLRNPMSWTARLAVPALWVGAELVRCRIVGQPWALLGYSQHSHTGLIQIAALTGVYGVSYLLVLGNVALVEAIGDLRSGRTIGPVLTRIGLIAAAIIGCWTAGSLVAEGGPTGGFNARPIAIVQTNVPPAFQWTRAYADRQLMAHIAATERLPERPRPALIVWPENAVTDYVENDPMLAARIGALAMRRGADILFGAPRYEDGRTFNSIRLVTHEGRNGGYYDKQHLVLVAERGILASSTPPGPTESPRQFSAGTEAGILKSFVPIGVSICHEIVYPELIRRSVLAGAELLVNVSNDGWLDGGSGMASGQHFAMATFRAVEARRYLVRGAVTGISGIIDPYGRVEQTLAPHTAGVVLAHVAGRNALTPYMRLGDAFAFGCSFVAALALAMRSPRLVWRRRRLVTARFAS